MAAATAGTGGARASCDSPPTASELTGWAATPGMGADTTTGGDKATAQTVTTLAAFTAAVSGDQPATVYVKGMLTPGSLKVGSNKTVVGLCGAELHGHLDINGASNVIIRNLRIVGYGVGDCARDPKYDAAVGCSSGDDAVSVQHAHHIWFDHCDISDGTDGNLDITNGADFVTVSWTKFHYTPRTDPKGNDSTGNAGHRFSNLIGGADGVAGDVGHLNVTWHHDWWADNVNQRMPRTRAGKIHVFNNLFTSSGNSYCTNAGAQATLLVEGNVYVGVSSPLKPDSNGDMREHDNIFMNTSGTKSASGMGFMPPYKYQLDPATSVQSAVEAGAGPH
jgi:pectate lyase